MIAPLIIFSSLNFTFMQKASMVHPSSKKPFNHCPPVAIFRINGIRVVLRRSHTGAWQYLTCGRLYCIIIDKNHELPF